MSVVRIRPAGPADEAAVAALHAASWQASYRGMLSDGYLDHRCVADRRDTWRRRFASFREPDQVVVLAERDGEPVGFCCLLTGAHPTWGTLIDNLHVRPGLTRHRLGVPLVLRAVALLSGAASGAGLHLTVLERNGRAVAAYESWGGRLVERADSREADGGTHPIRRYAWDSPAAFTRAAARYAQPGGTEPP